MTFFTFLRFFAARAIRIYFRKFQPHNRKAIPAKGPVIFIPNHQNAFLDAIAVICSQPREPWSIARASVFKGGFANRLLTAVQIKPVFRLRDGFGSLRNNDALMQEWSDMLYKGNDIIIFAEGNHNEPYAAGDLQRGFARMALQFEQKYNVPLTIIPVGFHYDDHYTFRSRLLINYGEPIHVDDIAKSELSEREKLEALADITNKALKSLAIAIPDDDQYKAKVSYLRKYRRFQKDMLKQLEADKQTLSEFPEPPVGYVEPRKLSMFWKVINPIVWIGLLFNIAPYAFISRFIRKKIKDPQWISSLKYAFGLLLLPFYYILLSVVIYIIYSNPWAALASLILIPAAGVFATDILKK